MSKVANYEIVVWACTNQPGSPGYHKEILNGRAIKLVDDTEKTVWARTINGTPRLEERNLNGQFVKKLKPDENGRFRISDLSQANGLNILQVRIK